MDFGDVPYWNNGTIATDAESYMLSVITTYSTMDRLHGLQLTPQYGFVREMKEFEQVGYDATVSKLNDNLIVMNAVGMLDKKKIMSDVYINALSYLLFLKRMRTGDVKARMCADSRPQQKSISSSSTVSTYTLLISCAMGTMEGR